MRIEIDVSVSGIKFPGILNGGCDQAAIGIAAEYSLDELQLFADTLGPMVDKVMAAVGGLDVSAGAPDQEVPDSGLVADGDEIPFL